MLPSRVLRSFSVFAMLTSLLLVPLAASPAAAADSLNEAQTLVLKSRAVFKSFMNDGNLPWFHENVHQAHGILIIPQMLRGGFILGGSGGSGTLLVRDRRTNSWSLPAFYTIGSLSLGLQVGADASEVVLLIMTEQGMNAMLSTELKLGADISVAVGPMGKNAKAQTADVLAFGRSMGIYGGISVEGAVLAPRNLWNCAYYMKQVSPMDILIQRTVVGIPQAEQLRAAMPGSRLGQAYREERQPLSPYGYQTWPSNRRSDQFQPDYFDSPHRRKYNQDDAFDQDWPRD